MPRTGTVKWFSDAKGYGFIEQPGGPDLYVHHSEIRMDGYRTLQPGMRVEFELKTTGGRMEAGGVHLSVPSPMKLLAAR